MDAATIALTGSTGVIGGAVARRVRDLRPLLLVRDPARAPDLGLASRPCSYGDTDAAVQALRGVDVLFFVSGHESPTRAQEQAGFVRAAARAGVGHVVYLSFAGASPGATFTLAHDHAHTEAELHELIPHVTVLRDNFYLDLLPHFAGPDGVLRGPAGAPGEGRVAAVARRDVVDVVEAVLRDPVAHRGLTATLTGPEALSLDEVAARAGAALGSRLRYEPETLEQARASRRAGWPEAPEWQVEAWVSTYTAIADGSVAQVTDDVARLTGHPARTLEQALLGDDA